MLTYEDAKRLFTYSPEDGFVRWNLDGIKKMKGAVAGCAHQGYWVIDVNHRKYLAHRIAYLLMTGKFPDGVMDHINGDGCDNKWGNLRAVSQQANMQNRRKPQANNLLGYLGVSKNGKKFKANIKCSGVNKHLGTFETPCEAYAAYLTAKRSMHVGCTI